MPLLVWPRKGAPCTAQSFQLEFFLFSDPENALSLSAPNEQQPQGTYLHNKGHDEIGTEHNDEVKPPHNRGAGQLVGDGDHC